MTRRKAKDMPHDMDAVLAKALPIGMAKRLPSAELMHAWQELAGEAVAQRARLVCLEPGARGAEGAGEGVLVVAVAGAAWRQEISLQAPRLAESLRRQGFAVASLRLVNAPSPPPEIPLPAPRHLSAEEESAVERQVEGVQDSKLRQSLAKAIRAQLEAEEETG